MIERRSILKGLVALVAAPAIIKVGSIMPINSGLQPGILTLDEYSRRILQPMTAQLRNIDDQYREQFGADGVKIGDQLRIRLPNDYVVNDGPSLSVQDVSRIDMRYIPLLRYNKERRSIDRVPEIVGPLALAAAVVAVAPAILEKPVTRRFWGK